MSKKINIVNSLKTIDPANIYGIRLLWLVTVAATVLTVMTIASAVRLVQNPNEDVQTLLSSPTVKERLLGNVDAEEAASVVEFVREARAFRTHLNGPKITKRPIQIATEIKPPKPKPPSPPPFLLKGLGYRADNPRPSIALVLCKDVKGQQTRWVQVGDRVGRYLIREIKADSVVCDVGNGTTEIALKLDSNRCQLVVDSPTIRPKQS